MTSGPVVVMIHGYRFQPHRPNRCPHGHIFSLERHAHPRIKSWPRHLGFGRGKAREGVAIAFGWNAGGHIWAAAKVVETAGIALAQVVQILRKIAPHRPVHLVAHSLGGQVALKAMQFLATNDLGRVILMNAASYQSTARDAVLTDAGKSCELFNMCATENAPYDGLFEWALRPPVAKDRALGRGFVADNALTVDLSQAGVIKTLRSLGFPVARRDHRICHWSTYMRPGVFPFYSALIRRPDDLPLAKLQRLLLPTSLATPEREDTQRPALLPRQIKPAS